MLPSSRNTTYGADSPVQPVDLNDLQDCIVGNKHPELEICLFASDFVYAQDIALPGQAGLRQAGYITGAGSHKAYAAVRVPVGKRVTTVEIFYDGANDAATLTPKFRKQILSTGVQADVVAGAADTGNGIESQVLTANHVVLAGNAYFIEVAVNAGVHRVHGAKVKFDAL